MFFIQELRPALNVQSDFVSSYFPYLYPSWHSNYLIENDRSLVETS